MAKVFNWILVGFLANLCELSYGQEPKSYCQTRFDQEPDLQLCFSPDYSETKPPLDPDDGQDYFELTLDIIVEEIMKVDDFDMTVEASLLLLMTWPDKRMRLREGVEEISLSRNYRSKMWIPDLELYNMVSFYQPSTITKYEYLGVTQDQRIEFHVPANVKISCPFTFDKFPFDRQLCPLKVASFALMNKTFGIAGQIMVEASEQRDLQYNLHIEPLKEEQKVFEFNFGEGGEVEFYAVHGFNINLKRNIYRIVLRTFLPTGLLVVLSWVSFVIDPTIVPGRMALLVTLLLVLINISNGLADEIPMSNSLTAMEQWMLLCIAFVIGALAEYSCTLFIMTREEKKIERTKMAKMARNKNAKVVTPGKRADDASLVIFPVLFILANIVFWGANLA